MSNWVRCGPTGTTVVVTIAGSAFRLVEARPRGTPDLQHHAFMFLIESLRPSGRRVVSRELYVAGLSLARGYLNGRRRGSDAELLCRLPVGDAPVIGDM